MDVNNLLNKIKPYLAKVITSNNLRDIKRGIFKLKRHLGRAPKRATVYLKIDDPHSYLLLQVLSEFQRSFELQYEFKIVFKLQDEMFPEQELWVQNTYQDANYLANLYNLTFPTPTSPLLARSYAASCELAAIEQTDHFIPNALAIFEAFWAGNEDELEALFTHYGCDTDAMSKMEKRIRLNEHNLRRNGHYLAATVYFEGEWYWGLDRLEHLASRLRAEGSKPKVAKEVTFDLAYRNFCQTDTDVLINVKPNEQKHSAITAYWSLRSPYSYIGLIRVAKLARYYQVPLIIKPVLPMVMRNLPVPNAKRNYILHDAKREADKYDIDFGYIVDPLGKGVERCYALFNYAKSEHKEIAFLTNYATAVWSQGIDSATDEGLKKIVNQSGLDWEKAKALLNDSSWQDWAKTNLNELYEHNLWGVPSFGYQGKFAFGQDRLGYIEALIIDDLGLKPNLPTT